MKIKLSQLAALAADDAADILTTVSRIAKAQGITVRTLAEAIAYAKEDEDAAEYFGQYIDID